jgi:hypothetical protein
MSGAPVRRDPAALRSQPARDGTEFHPTPSCLAGALTAYVLPSLPAGPIWECAAGAGALVHAMRAAGYTVAAATDLVPRGADIGRLDFLHDEPPADGLVAVTNPPHSAKLLNPFLTRGLRLLDRNRITGLVLLLRLDHLMAGGRVGALNHAASITHCSWRARWLKGTKGNPRWTYLWVTWLPGHDGPTEARFLLPAHRRGDLLESSVARARPV